MTDARELQEDLERLFGKGHRLTVQKALYQDGFFAAEETVTLIGPRQRMISGLRILGPCRDHSQVELAFTDAIYLGLDVPVRKSGDHRDSPLVVVVSREFARTFWPGETAIGKRVRVAFQDLSADFALPQFTLTDEPAEGRAWRFPG